MTLPAFVPGTGDLIWTDFDPITGREQADRPPALVISSVAFTKNTGLAIVSRSRRAFGHFQPVSFYHPASPSPARS